ncbi:E3 ubiquitin-protein ligase TRAIP [Anabrus simplex]|uniref:E3 ubiquitin-protein ligase TRAIP n=1 Tax=Anabrus simplex TaxID=316456 RepID=UPI0035A2A2B6
MEAEKAFSECENLRKHVELQREEIKKLEGKVREVASNMAVLREQNQCLRKQAMEAEKAVSECENLRKRVELQREEITELEGIVIEDASNMAVLREQKECLRKQAMEAEKAVSECENLRKHVELQREKTKKLEGKVREEASRMAVLREQNQCLRKQTIDAECAVYECENLRKHVVFLQREMKSMTEEKGNILNGVIELGMLAMFFLEYQTSQSKLDFQINAKRQLEKDLEHLEHERKRPLKKIKLLEEAMISPSTSHPAESAPRRLIAESPAPVDIQRPKLSDPEDDMLTHSLQVTMADEKECDDQLMTNLTSNHWTNHLSPDSPSLEGIEKLERKLREASSNTAVLREQTQCLLKQTKEAEKAVNKCTRVEKYFEFLQRSRGPERSGSFT